VPYVVLAHCAVNIHIAYAFPQRSDSGLPSYFSNPPDRSVVSEADRRRWYRPSGLSRGLFLGSPLVVPDVSQQRAVAGQMAGDTAKVTPSSTVRLVASLPKRLVSHLLADGQSESVPEGPLQGAIAFLCSVLTPRAGFRSPHCLPPRLPSDELLLTNQSTR
jgi:hypothetical protein